MNELYAFGLGKGGFKMSNEDFFPEIIKKLPKVDISIDGVDA